MGTRDLSLVSYYYYLAQHESDTVPLEQVWLKSSTERDEVHFQHALTHTCADACVSKTGLHLTYIQQTAWKWVLLAPHGKQPHPATNPFPSEK